MVPERFRAAHGEGLQRFLATGVGPVNAFAPRLARHRVEEIDHMAPDLRDAVTLLTSDLVTRAVRACPSDAGPDVRLSAWMPDDFVRVELRSTRAVLHSGAGVDCSPHEKAVLDQVADRWSVDQGDEDVCMWFEIDRGASAACEFRTSAAGYLTP
jgi:hypothetical protein